MSHWQIVDMAADIPAKPAIYAIFTNGNLAYIGTTEWLVNRLVAHRVWMEEHPPAAVIIKATFHRPDLRRRRELALIRRLRPRKNRLPVLRQGATALLNLDPAVVADAYAKDAAAR